MKDQIKALIRWWDDSDHQGMVVCTIVYLVGAISVGVASESWLLGIFWAPLLIIAALTAGIVFGLPLGLLLYFLFDILPRAYRHVVTWAYSHESKT